MNLTPSFLFASNIDFKIQILIYFFPLPFDFISKSQVVSYASQLVESPFKCLHSSIYISLHVSSKFRVFLYFLQVKIVQNLKQVARRRITRGQRPSLCCTSGPPTSFVGPFATPTHGSWRLGHHVVAFVSPSWRLDAMNFCLGVPRHSLFCLFSLVFFFACFFTLAPLLHHLTYLQNKTSKCIKNVLYL